MGIIAKQSIYNTVSIGLAFLIGAANILFLYPTFPGKEFQGLVVALLANSNLIQPFISFGVQHPLIKFFSSTKSKEDQDRLLWFSIGLPFLRTSVDHGTAFDIAGKNLASLKPMLVALSMTRKILSNRR